MTESQHMILVEVVAQLKEIAVRLTSTNLLRGREIKSIAQRLEREFVDGY